MTIMIPTILKLDVGGAPVEWISWQTAATLYARDRVRWEAGDARFTVFGGRRRDGSRSSLTINSIIAVHDRSRKFERRRPPPLTNRALFERDGYICLYCGLKFPASRLSLDHVVPQAMGGRRTWRNSATACRSCNEAKADRPPEQFRPLLAVPYEPDPAAYLLLISGPRRITACQQTWLESFADKRRKLS